jgi:hypothetical protein
MPPSKDPALRANQLANLPNLRGEPPANAFTPGNTARLVHGFRTVNPSPIVLDPIVREIAEALGKTLPMRDANDEVPAADRYALELAALALLRVRRTHAYLELRGDTDDTGRLRPEFEMLGKAIESASRALDRLGCSPLARARLGLDLAQTERARGAALRDHLDARYPVDVEQEPGA